MKRKTLIIATFLTASLLVGTTAQAHDDYGYPLGLFSGVLLGLSLDGGDHYYYRDRPSHHYRHRDYRRHDSHGYRHRDYYKGHHRHDRYRDKHHHKHDRKHDHGRYRD